MTELVAVENKLAPHRLVEAAALHMVGSDRNVAASSGQVSFRNCLVEGNLADLAGDTLDSLAVEGENLVAPSEVAVGQIRVVPLQAVGKSRAVALNDKQRPSEGFGS